MSTLTTLVGYLRELLGDEAARQDFRADPQGHLAEKGFEPSEPELREAVSLVGHDHSGDAGFGDLSVSVDNFGDADANTGRNTGIGNASDNDANSFQDAHAGGAGGGNGFGGGHGGVGDDATAVNQAANANVSDGTAAIATGNAQAVGNIANTNIVQNAGSFGDSGGIVIGDQEANVTNVGSANADTGHNPAVGNASDNDANSFQDANAGGGFGGGVGDDASAVNSAANTNASDGTAVIETGNASAVGNVAETNISQTGPSFGSGGGIYIGDQEANVTNVGSANANTGANTAVGNASHNDANSFQDANAGGGFGGGVGDDASAVNSAANTNVSDGTAAVHTGDASAVGNVAETNIAQGGDSHHVVEFGDGPGGGIYIHEQEADVTNFGDADANTGGNTAVGNASHNDANSFQDADAGGGFDPFGGVGDDATAVNDAHNLNASHGTALVDTGDADAVGNVAENLVDQMDLDVDI
ncbi:MAG TPA: hypothetical protein VMZ22_03255 [Acidimicrobiales bacterium]|nr:hypothetical protein [Acidimicrobiales bacterium]